MAGPPTAGAPVPTLAMAQLVAAVGVFPTPDAQPPAQFTMGMIHSYAGVPGGWAPFPFGMPQARGQMRQIKDFQALFSVVGTAYGGDGAKTFQLPNLHGLAPTNPLPNPDPFAPPPGTAPVQWLIASKGVTRPPPPPPPAPPHFPPGFPPPPPMPPIPPLPTPGLLQTGMMAMYAGSDIPGGWLACDGSMISEDDHPELCAVLGNAFGWLPGGSVALPQLTGQVVIGPPAGTVPGQTRGWIPGDAFQTAPPALVCQWLICTTGPFPQVSPPGHILSLTPDAAFLGQVIAYAGTDVPAGWAACDGSLVSIAENDVLFVLLQNAYGGDAITNFALPDLRGVAMVGS